MSNSAVLFTHLPLIAVGLALVFRRNRVRGATLVAQCLLVWAIVAWVRAYGHVSSWPYRHEVPPWHWLWLYGVTLPHLFPQLVLSVAFFFGLVTCTCRWMAKRGKPIPLWGIWIFLISVVFFLGIAFVTRPSIRYS
jgi:hypothetical protein